MPGGVEDQRHDDDPRRLLRRPCQPFFHQYVGKFDEAQFDRPFRPHFTPATGEFLDFLIAFRVTRAVADE